MVVQEGGQKSQHGNDLMYFFVSNSLVARAHRIKCEELGCPGFEPRPLNKICIVPTN